MTMAEHNLLVVDKDDDFVSSAKELFEGRLPVARSIEEASQTAESGELRMLLLGPSFSNDESLEQIRSLHNQDPALILMMVAETVTSDLLRGAMRAGVSDVIEAPLDETKIEAAIEQFGHDVLKRRSAAKPTEEPVRTERGAIVTVTSAKGGSGKTVSPPMWPSCSTGSPTRRWSWSTPICSSAMSACCCSWSRGSRW